MSGLTFYPALGKDIHLSVLPYLDVAHLKFTAFFESTDVFDKFKRDGVRVELWADVQKEGQWVGVPFQDFNERGSPPFSVDCDTRRPLQLHAIISIPVLGQTCIRGFSYTFRLVYASGQIKWLGDYKRDGAIFLERGDSRISLIGVGWSTTAGGSSQIWKSRGHVDDMDVARLNSELQWIVCAVSKDGLPKLQSVGEEPVEFSVACLIPAAGSKEMVVPRPLVLSASQGCSTSVTSTGIRLSGNGSLLFQTYHTGLSLDQLLDVTFRQSSSPAGLISCDSTSGCLILASPKYTNPVSAVIISLLPSATLSPTSVTKPTLSTLLPSTSAFTVYLPSLGDAKFFTSNQEHISLNVPSSGVEFVLSPSYNLSDDIGPSWDVSFTSPYAPPPGDNLPTPPPSPRFRPLQQKHPTSTQLATSSPFHLPIIRLVPYVLIGLICHVLDAVWVRIFGGSIMSSQKTSAGTRAPLRELRSAPDRKKPPPAISVDVKGETVTILARCNDLKTRPSAVDQIEIELDGKVVLPMVIELSKDEGNVLLVVNGCDTGGRMKISLKGS